MNIRNEQSGRNEDQGPYLYTKNRYYYSQKLIRITIKEDNIRTVYQYTKVKFNYLLDRVIDVADMTLMDVYQLPVGQSLAHKIGREVSDVSRLLRDFPRLPVYKLQNSTWTIIFIGGEEGRREIAHLFFYGQSVSSQEVGRLSLWDLTNQTEQWMFEGVDLVIYQSSRIHNYQPPTQLTFTIPIWINQILSIPEPVELILAGKKFATERHRINKAKRDGFSYQFSQSEDDFNLFYHRMYLPYIKARHGNLALVASYNDQLTRWLTKGGLILVTKNGQAIAGGLRYISDGVCYAVEDGILDGDMSLFRGINTLLVWYTIVWAHSQGARLVNMGGTHSWQSNGSFKTKRRWGAKVVRRRKSYGKWTFGANKLTKSQQEQINNIGFISEIGSLFFRVYIVDTDAPPDLTALLTTTARQGLAGVVITSPQNGLQIYRHDS